MNDTKTHSKPPQDEKENDPKQTPSDRSPNDPQNRREDATADKGGDTTSAISTLKGATPYREN